MTIITSYQYYAINIAFTIIFACLVVCIYFLGVCIAEYYSEKDNKIDSKIMWFGFVIALFFGLLLGKAIAPAPTTRYEVTLDAEYPANEFLDNYTVIEKLGHSYLVERKE